MTKKNELQHQNSVLSNILARARMYDKNIRDMRRYHAYKDEIVSTDASAKDRHTAITALIRIINV